MKIKRIWKKAAGYVGCAAAGLILGVKISKSNPPNIDDLVEKKDNWYQLTIPDESMTHKYLIYHDEYRNFQLLVKKEESYHKSPLGKRELADLCIGLDKNHNGILEQEELK